MSTSVQQATLCFLVDGSKVLLAMKKRGWGKGWWNGVGGKINPKEKVGTALLRETEEEIGVELEHMEKVALIHFYFPTKKDWDLDVHVFIGKKWKGSPVETEEMKPRWFNVDNIPYNKMWDSDKIWISKVLAGDKIEAQIEFGENLKMVNYQDNPLSL